MSHTIPQEHRCRDDNRFSLICLVELGGISLRSVNPATNTCSLVGMSPRSSHVDVIHGTIRMKSSTNAPRARLLGTMIILLQDNYACNESLTEGDKLGRAGQGRAGLGWAGFSCVAQLAEQAQACIAVLMNLQDAHLVT